MREILFHGKRADNGEWIEGDVLQTRYHSGHIEYQIMPQTPVSSAYPVLSETIGQYTGLTDRNGKKIFEGDIVKTHYANAQKSDFIEQVVFHNGKFCAYFSNQLCKQWVNLYDGTEHLPQDKSVYMDSVEVIGNIHDNPELLKNSSL